MYPAATIDSPHRRSSWADAGKGKGVVIQGLKGGEPRFGAATGVMPHGGSAAGKKVERPLTGALLRITLYLIPYRGIPTSRE